jgi:hypothetical protein
VDCQLNDYVLKSTTSLAIEDIHILDIGTPLGFHDEKHYYMASIGFNVESSVGHVNKREYTPALK